MPPKRKASWLVSGGAKSKVAKSTPSTSAGSETRHRTEGSESTGTQSDMTSKNVTGMTGGKADTVFAVGENHGGVGNTVTHNNENYSAPGANIGQMGREGKATGTTFESTKPAGTKGANIGQFAREGTATETTFESNIPAGTKDMTSKHVTGMTGGKADTVCAVGENHGGVGHTVTHNNENYFAPGANIGQMGRDGTAIETKFGSTKPAGTKAIRDYTVTDICNLLRSEKFTDETIKCFEDNGIDGKYFVNLSEDAVLKELGISSALEKMKLKTLIKTFV